MKHAEGIVQQAVQGVPSIAQDLLTREEALRQLGVQRATLYTYVSRGWIRSVPQHGTRQRLFCAEDIAQLKSRGAVHSGTAPRGETSLRWGEPVLQSSITAIGEAGPVYRGYPAVQLAEQGVRFENVAQLLWTGSLVSEPMKWSFAGNPDEVQAELQHHSHADIARALAWLALSSGGRDDCCAEDMSYAKTLLAKFARAVLRLAPHDRIATVGDDAGVADVISKCAGMADVDVVHAINAALVLCADLELAPATFAARVAASAGCEVSSCVAVGITTHAGGLTGGSAGRAERLLFHELADSNFEDKLHIAKTLGSREYGFNHPLFPAGDPRATALLVLARSFARPGRRLQRALAFVDEARERHGLHPGMGLSLAVLCQALRLPEHGPLALWTLGRTAGLIAHVTEQKALGFKIRPRAYYVGPQIP